MTPTNQQQAAAERIAEKIGRDPLFAITNAMKAKIAAIISAELSAVPSEQPVEASTAEPLVSANYACDDPKCGWRSTDTSRPLSRGTKVGCPDCNGSAHFVSDWTPP